jgi:methyl-accepting chemotaxis protein
MSETAGNRKPRPERWGLRRRLALVIGGAAASAALVVAAALSGLFPFPAVPFLWTLPAPFHIAALATLAGLLVGFLLAAALVGPVVRGLHVLSSEVARSGVQLRGRVGIGLRMNQLIQGVRDLASREREGARAREALESYAARLKALEAVVARAAKNGEIPPDPEEGPFRAMESVATRLLAELVRYRKGSAALLGEVNESMEEISTGIGESARLAEKSFMDSSEAGVLLRDLGRTVDRALAAAREGRPEADPGPLLLRLRDEIQALVSKLEAIGRNAEGASRTAHRAGRDVVEVEREISALRERIGGERVEVLSERNFVPDFEEPEDLS